LFFEELLIRFSFAVQNVQHFLQQNKNKTSFNTKRFGLFVTEDGSVTILVDLGSMTLEIKYNIKLTVNIQTFGFYKYDEVIGKNRFSM